MELDMLELLLVALISFLSKMLEGLTGVGDSLIFPILWYVSCVVLLSDASAFESAVDGMRYLMYVRLALVPPLDVYLRLNSKNLLSYSTLMMMSVTSTAFACVGIIIAMPWSANDVRWWLCWTSLACAGMYVMAALGRAMYNKVQLDRARKSGYSIRRECTAIEAEARVARKSSLVNLRADFIHVGQASQRLLLRPPHYPGHVPRRPLALSPVALGGGGATATDVVVGTNLAHEVPTSEQMASDRNTSTSAEDIHARPIVYLSTVTGEVFSADEVVEPMIRSDGAVVVVSDNNNNNNNNNMGPSTTTIISSSLPLVVSPCRTRTFAKVRIGRHLDEHGNLSFWSVVWCATCAAICALLASFVGIHEAALHVVERMMDLPQSIIRLNFAAQSVPAGVARALLVIFSGNVSSIDYLPLFADTIIFSYLGSVVAHHYVKRCLGPWSTQICVVSMLLLDALIGSAHNAVVLCFFSFVAATLTGVGGYLEMKKFEPILAAQRRNEREVEQRVPEVMSYIQQHTNNSTNNNGTANTCVRAGSANNNPVMRADGSSTFSSKEAQLRRWSNAVLAGRMDGSDGPQHLHVHRQHGSPLSPLGWRGSTTGGGSTSVGGPADNDDTDFLDSTGHFTATIPPSNPTPPSSFCAAQRLQHIHAPPHISSYHHHHHNNNATPRPLFSDNDDGLDEVPSPSHTLAPSKSSRAPEATFVEAPSPSTVAVLVDDDEHQHDEHQRHPGEEDVRWATTHDEDEVYSVSDGEDRGVP